MASSPWLNLVISFRGLSPEHEEELVGGLVEVIGALGASDVNEPENIRWRLSFPATVDRAEAENLLQSYLLQALDEEIGAVSFKWDWEEQPDENWAVAYRSYFQPVEVAPFFRIMAPWHERTALDDRLNIIINPGQGFGTGTHETTQLCLERLPELITPQTCMLDAGSGSGILSIAAALLGAAHVDAVEIDPAANVNARENIELNAVQDRIEIIEGSPKQMAGQQYDLVVCNMLLVNSSKLFPELARMVKPAGYLVLAGFLTREADQAKALFEGEQGNFSEMNEKGEWASFVWHKEKGAQA